MHCSPYFSQLSVLLEVSLEFKSLAVLQEYKYTKSLFPVILYFALLNHNESLVKAFTS